MSSLFGRIPPKSVRPETKLVVSLVGGSHFINHMYLILLPPIFGLLITELDASLTQLGLAVGVLNLFSTLFQLPFGYLSDNYGRTPTLGTGLSVGAIGVFVLAFSPTFTWLLVGQALLGIGIAAHHPAHFPLLSDATPQHHRGRVFSIHGFAGNLGYAAAPAITAATLSVPGLTWRHALFLIGVFGAAYAILSILVLSRSVSDEVTHNRDVDVGTEYSMRSLRQRVVDEVHSLFTLPAVLAMALLSLVTATSSWAIRAYVIVLLTAGYGMGLNVANTILTVMFVASAVLGLVGGELSDRFSASVVIIGSYVLLMLSTAAVASLFLPATIAILGVVIAGGSTSLGGPAKSKLVDTFSGRGDLGKSFAIITVGTSVGGSVAPPFFGWVIESADVRVAFFLVSAIALLAGVIVTAIIYQYRDVVDAPAVIAGDD